MPNMVIKVMVLIYIRQSKSSSFIFKRIGTQIINIQVLCGNSNLHCIEIGRAVDMSIIWWRYL